MKSLYELAKDFKTAELDMIDMGADGQTVTDTLESMVMPVEEKAINVAKYIGNIQAEAEAIDSAIKAMTARKKSLEKKAGNMTHYLKTSMETCGIDRLSCEFFELAIVNNPDKLIIDNEDEIPENFMVPKTTTAPDKRAIKAYIGNNPESWAHVEKSTRLRIK